MYFSGFAHRNPSKMWIQTKAASRGGPDRKELPGQPSATEEPAFELHRYPSREEVFLHPRGRNQEVSRSKEETQGFTSVSQVAVDK